MDRFLATSVDAITAAYPGEPVGWLVLRFDPLGGVLSVDPAPEPSWEQGDERVHLELHSSFLQRQAERLYNSSSDGSYEPLYRRFWALVRTCLQDAELGSKLVAARQEHPLRIAAYNAPSGCGDEDRIQDIAESGGADDGGRVAGS